jgi:hypothetical protein
VSLARPCPLFWRTPHLISSSVTDRPGFTRPPGNEMNCIGFKRRIKFH